MSRPVELTDTPTLSPCVGICKIMPANGYCAGCFRTIDEIRQWQGMLPEQRRTLLSMLDARRLGLDATEQQCGA